MNLSEFLHSQAERAGYDTALLKDIVTKPEIMAITVPDDFRSQVNNALLTVSEAKINGEIKKHFAGVHLGSVDATIGELMDEFAIPDEIKGELKAQTSTFERIKLFTKKLASLKEEAAQAAGGDKAKLVQEITKLNGEISSMKEAMKAEVSKVNAEWQGRYTDHLVNSKFTGYEYAMENVPVDVQASSARILFERKLQEKGGKLKYQDGKITLVSATDDALPFTIDNKAVEFDSFADSVVAENKLIKVKGAPAPAPSPSPLPSPHKVDTPAAPAARGQVQKAIEELRSGSN